MKDEEVDYIPYFEDILLSAGAGATNGDYSPTELITVPKNIFTCKNIEAVKIIGDSMMPTISENAIVFIARDETQIKNGQIYALRLEEETYLKRLFQTPDGIIVKSDNEIYPQYTVDKTKLNIIGQIKGVLQKL
jgi:phage repressor protein C with HTH and peptisase S24 domain